MISTVDLYKEIGIYEKMIEQKDISDVDFKKATIKIGLLQTKLLHNFRTNSVRVMEHFKIEKVKPQQRREGTDRVETTAKKPEKEGK